MLPFDAVTIGHMHRETVSLFRSIPQVNFFVTDQLRQELHWLKNVQLISEERSLDAFTALNSFNLFCLYFELRGVGNN